MVLLGVNILSSSILATDLVAHREMCSTSDASTDELARPRFCQIVLIWRFLLSRAP